VAALGGVLRPAVVHDSLGERRRRREGRATEIWATAGLLLDPAARCGAAVEGGEALVFYRISLRAEGFVSSVVALAAICNQTLAAGRCT
jgi:hypothetical protein